MNLVRFDPFGVVRDIDRLFEDMGRPVATGNWLPRVDVFERDANLVVRAEVPGIDSETLDVTVEGGTLTLTGSRSFEDEKVQGEFHRKEIFDGAFKRTVLLPEGVDADAITAISKDGILEVVIPKRPEVLPRKVTVEVQR
jgi:HSP20 family protein